MSDNRKLEGRRAALALVSKMKPESTPAGPQEIEGVDLLVQAVQALAESQLDLSAVEEAIRGLKLEVGTTDLSAVVSALEGLDLSVGFEVDTQAIVDAIKAQSFDVDLRPIESELKNIRKAVENGNAVLLQLVKVAKASKIVEYDAQGRVTEIKVKT